MKKSIILLAILLAISVLAIPGTLAMPQFNMTSAKVSVANNTEYNPIIGTTALSYGFQINITDNATASMDPINKSHVLFQHNFGGTTTNGTTKNNTAGIFWVNFTHITNISAANTIYTYTWYAANMTSGIQNKSASRTYFIKKNQTAPVCINITVFNAAGTESNVSQSSASSYEGKGNPFASCTMEKTTRCTGTNNLLWGVDSLYKDGVAWTEGTSGATSLQAGTYTIKCNSTGNANYTSNATGESFTLTILRGGGGGGGDGWVSPRITMPTVRLPTMPSLPSDIPGQVRVRVQEVFARIQTWISSIRMRWQFSLMNWFRGR